MSIYKKIKPGRGNPENPVGMHIHVSEMKDRRVKGYPFDEMRSKEELRIRTYEYDMPFNYPNIMVYRKNFAGGEFHGIELFTTNKATERLKLGRVVPGQWTLMQAAYEPPPDTTTAELWVVINNMAPEESHWIADAFVGEVPADWNQQDDIPSGARNLISNPTFAGAGSCPRGWNLTAADGEKLLDTDGGKLTVEKWDAAGHAGLKIESAQIALRTEVPVQPLRRIVCSLWAKSTNKLPKGIWFFPRWKDKAGAYVRDIGGDRIIIAEEQPIVRVAVIGSACTPPGYVMLEAEPYEEFYRRGDFVRCTAPLRFKQGNLWGMHLRFDQWGTLDNADLNYEDIPAGLNKRNPGINKVNVKAHFKEFPFTGMSCAVFEIPKSRKVTIYAGGDNPIWASDNSPDDDHYSIRTIRTTVAVRRE